MGFIAKKRKNKDLIKHKDLIQKYKDYKAGLYPPEKEELDTTTKTIVDIEEYLEEQYINEILKQQWDKPSIYEVFTAYERRVLKRILKLDNL